jgi:iron(III) transport system permease protein
MVALAVLFSLMALLPLGFIIAIGIETGWETIKALVFRPRVAELLSNTLWLTALAVPLCIVLGVAIAWLTERTQLAAVVSGPRLRLRRWRSRHLCKAMPG